MNTAKKEYWTKQLEEFESSELSEAKWCVGNRIVLSSFKYYKRKFSKDTLKKIETTKFISLNITKRTTKEERLPLVVKIGNSSIEVPVGCDIDTLENVISILVKQC